METQADLLTLNRRRMHVCQRPSLPVSTLKFIFATAALPLQHGGNRGNSEELFRKQQDVVAARSCKMFLLKLFKIFHEAPYILLNPVGRLVLRQRALLKRRLPF